MTRTSRPTDVPVSTIVPPAASDAVPARRSRPRSEEALGHAVHVEAGEVTADDERGPLRPQRPLVGGTQAVGRQPLHGVACPAGRPVIGRVRGVDRPDERFLDPSPRIRLGLQQVVQPFVAQALDLGLREGRLEEDLRDQLERRLETAGGDVDADRQCVPAGLGVERRAEALGGLRQGDRVVPFGALGQRPGGEDHGTGLTGRLLDRSAGQDQRRRDERSPGQVRDQQSRAVGEGPSGDRRELVGTRRTRLRTIRQDGAVGTRIGRGAHAATSSSPVVD